MKNILKFSIFSFIFISSFAQNMQSKPEIINAWYGNDDPKYMPNNEKTSEQVVNKLRSIVDKYGFIAIPAAQHKFYGFDPLPNVKKTTAIHIRHLGKEIGNLRAPEGSDFVYPTNTDSGLAQKALQEIKATLTTAPEPTKEVPSSPTLQPGGQAPSSPPIFPDICLRSDVKDQQRIEESGIVFYFVPSGNNTFKAIPVEKKVCSIVSKNIPYWTGVEVNLRDFPIIRSVSRMSEFRDIVLFENKWLGSRQGLFSEACPESIINAQEMINTLKDPNKISLDLSRRPNLPVIHIGIRPKGYLHFGEVIGVIINHFNFPGNCTSGPALYAITPVPSATNPFFKITQAIYSGNLSEFKQIIESQSIDINQPLAWTNTTPLTEAIKSKQIEIALYLINKGAIITENDVKLISDATMYQQLAPFIVQQTAKRLNSSVKND